MYENFYELKEKPFQIAPNPTYLYRSSVHENALIYLEYGLKESLGLILLTGPVGTGKTMLLKHILGQVETEKEVGLVFNTNVNVDQLLCLILQSFGLAPDGHDKTKNLKILTQFLRTNYANGKHVLLVIDEAQNLTDSALEEIRMISNVQSDERNLLQIVLVGQPELKTRLQQPIHASFAQRIAVNITLSRLSVDETKSYIAYRLEKAGGRPDLFSPEAIESIFEFSKGIPRTINQICDTALVYGFADAAETIGAAVIEEVVADKVGVGIHVHPETSDIPSPSILEHQADWREKDQFQKVEDSVQLLQNKIDSLSKLTQNNLILGEAVGELVKKSSTRGAGDRLEPLSTQKSESTEQPKILVEPPREKSAKSHWLLIVLVCFALVAAGYYIGFKGLYPQFFEFLSSVDIQQQDEADQAEKANSSNILVAKTQSFERYPVNAEEIPHESENTSQISPENTVNSIDRGSQPNTSLSVGLSESLKDASEKPYEDLSGKPLQEASEKSADNALERAVFEAPAEDQALSSDHQETEHAEPPAILGQLAVQPADTVSSLIEAVYGVYSNNYLNKLKQSNPRLKNANILTPEDVIVFPSIPIEIKPMDINRRWIRIETKRNLAAAMEALRVYPAELPSVRIVPFWQAGEGVQFDIISNNAFRDQVQLSEALARIRSYFTNIDIIAFNQWEPDTIFMADPSNPIGD